MPAAEITGQSTLKMMIRALLDLFVVEKNNLILTVINDSNWYKTSEELQYSEDNLYIHD